MKRASESASVVYVDLSANAEQLSQDSAIAVSDGVRWVCLARSKIKRHLAQRLVERYGRRHLQYRLLAALVYLAISDRLDSIQQIVIDQDYTGAEADSVIKNYLLALIRKRYAEAAASFVRFEQIKGSSADRLARATFQGQVSPDFVVTMQQVEELFAE